MNERNPTFITGAVLLLIGVALFLRRLGLFFVGWEEAYPLVMLALAAALFYATFKKTDRTSAFPATVLLILGSFYFLRNFSLLEFDYYFFEFRDYWPVFLIAFGAGFVVQSLLKVRGKGALVAGGALLFFGTGLLMHSLGLWWGFDLAALWPLLLIAAGVALVAKTLYGASKDDSERQGA